MLETDDIGNISRNTPLYFHDQKVGIVLSTIFDSATKKFHITTFVHAPYADLVHPETRFWSAGPFHLTFTPSGPSLDFQSLPALIQGQLHLKRQLTSPYHSRVHRMPCLRCIPTSRRRTTRRPRVASPIRCHSATQQSGLPVGAQVQLQRPGHLRAQARG